MSFQETLKITKAEDLTPAQRSVAADVDRTIQLSIDEGVDPEGVVKRVQKDLSLLSKHANIDVDIGNCVQMGSSDNVHLRIRVEGAWCVLCINPMVGVYGFTCKTLDAVSTSDYAVNILDYDELLTNIAKRLYYAHEWAQGTEQGYCIGILEGAAHVASCELVQRTPYFEELETSAVMDYAYPAEAKNVTVKSIKDGILKLIKA